jgi:hypothetical protein
MGRASQIPRVSLLPGRSILENPTETVGRDGELIMNEVCMRRVGPVDALVADDE